MGSVKKQKKQHKTKIWQTMAGPWLKSKQIHKSPKTIGKVQQTQKREKMADYGRALESPKNLWQFQNKQKLTNKTKVWQTMAGPWLASVPP